MGTEISCGFGSAQEGAALQYHHGPEKEFCMTSFEQIFSPIMITRGGGAGATMANIPGVPPMDSMSNDEDGPFSGGDEQGKGALGPTRLELDPYFSAAYGETGQENQCVLTNDFLLFGNNGRSMRGGAQGDELCSRKLADRNAVNTVFTHAFRGPMLLSGWGYDLAGMPARPAAHNAQDQFNRTTFDDRTTWATGPINLMWDKERQVWQGGQQIVCGYVDGTSITAGGGALSSTYFWIDVINGAIRTAQNEPQPGGRVLCTNYDPNMNVDVRVSDIFVVAIRINYEWIPILPSGKCSECGGD
jgi:hypothetical protein